MKALGAKITVAGIGLLVLSSVILVGWLTYSTDARTWLSPLTNGMNRRKGRTALESVPFYDNFESAYIGGVTALVIGSCMTIFLLVSGIGYLTKLLDKSSEAGSSLPATVFAVFYLTPPIVGVSFLPTMFVLNMFSQFGSVAFGFVVGFLFPLFLMLPVALLGMGLKKLFVAAKQNLLKLSPKRSK
jgi:hypothetical protein